jgi:scyllo-inositol 2-dehydrogenase (NADP+)
VIIEKPLTPTSEESRELLEIAQSHVPPLIIAPYHNRRFDSDFLTIQRLIERGTFGDIAEFESRYDRYRPSLKGGTWKEKAGAGQGIVYDLGSHLVRNTSVCECYLMLDAVLG